MPENNNNNNIGLNGLVKNHKKRKINEMSGGLQGDEEMTIESQESKVIESVKGGNNPIVENLPFDDILKSSQSDSLQNNKSDTIPLLTNDKAKFKAPSKPPLQGSFLKSFGPAGDSD